LEIGCGNGLLTASFAKNEAKIRAIGAIDVSHAAVSATYENAATQRQFHGGGISERAHFITGRYQLDVVPRCSDLVVCNPPYIPEQPTESGRRAHPLAAATVGTALLQQVLVDAPNLISPNGELFIISSALAEPEINGAMSSNMTIEEVARRLVPFDIEAIRGEGEDEYISWLRAERGLELRGKILFHNIAIFRVRHSSNTSGNFTSEGGRERAA
jgi:methylase of polypeptide subunit release factors